jgi:hypothetical protein
VKWKKLGKIIEQQKHLSWMHSHTMLPVVDHLEEDLYRIYFCGRDKGNRSLIGFAEVNLSDPFGACKYADKPAFSLGELGCFDDNGVSPSSLVRVGNQKYLYYIGWKPRSTTRFGLIAGLAVSDDDGLSFYRESRAPILQVSDKEPISILTAPFVLKEDDEWKMWYVSGKKWINPDLPTYNIKYATSNDGVNWVQTGIVCIENRDEESALARPFVLKEDGIYKMWYSYKYKSNPYTIGYAESLDGIKWQRKDSEAGISVSKSGWDSEMIEYACVFNHKDKKYMLYNGNGYGENGIGLAILDE